MCSLYKWYVLKIQSRRHIINSCSLFERSQDSMDRRASTCLGLAPAQNITLLLYAFSTIFPPKRLFFFFSVHIICTGLHLVSTLRKNIKMCVIHTWKNNFTWLLGWGYFVSILGEIRLWKQYSTMCLTKMQLGCTSSRNHINYQQVTCLTMLLHRYF